MLRRATLPPDNLSGQPRTDCPSTGGGQHPPFRGCPSGVRSEREEGGSENVCHQRRTVSLRVLRTIYGARLSEFLRG